MILGPRQVLADQKFGVDPRNQYLFVIAAVKDADPPTLRQAERRPPQEIVGVFFY